MSSPAQDRLWAFIDRCYLAATDAGGGPESIAAYADGDLDPDELYRYGYITGFTNALQLMGNSPRLAREPIADALVVQTEIRHGA